VGQEAAKSKVPAEFQKFSAKISASFAKEYMNVQRGIAESLLREKAVRARDKMTHILLACTAVAMPTCSLAPGLGG
jgi:hypothetical protein